MGFQERLGKWYRGRYVPPPENEPGSPVVFISAGHFEQPALARLIGVLWRFWLADWKWILTFALGLAGLFKVFAATA